MKDNNGMSSFDYENNFYHTCDYTRMAKWAAHYEFFKRTWELPGTIIECGLFKGISFIRFAMFRKMFGNNFSKKMIGFDVFGEFPKSDFEGDQVYIDRFLNEVGSKNSISIEELNKILDDKGVNENLELIKGDICETIPKFIEREPSLKISLLHLDPDIYEPSVTTLEYLWPRLVKGGILILDDYGKFTGETTAADDYFKDKDVEIKKFPFCQYPSYIIKETF
tara:strand:+ start:461 stop:1129 length:669 start_codon:yes stop_codon:yes gene_type:complete